MSRVEVVSRLGLKGEIVTRDWFDIPYRLRDKMGKVIDKMPDREGEWFK